MNLATTFSCLFILFFLAACAPGEPPHTQAMATIESESRILIFEREFTPDEIEQGRAVYAQYCAACHGANGEGQFPAAPLEPDATGRYGAPPHDGTGHTWHHSDALLIRYVTEGGFADPNRFYPMPPFGAVLTEDQILYVLAYIKTMWDDEQRGRQRTLTLEEERLMQEAGGE